VGVPVFEATVVEDAVVEADIQALGKISLNIKKSFFNF
jgi:hypothetical protein